MKVEIAIVFAAKYLIYLLALVVLLFIVLRVPKSQQKTLILRYTVSILVAVVITKLAGNIYHNPRPFVDSNIAPLVPHSPTNGFPSNHMVAASLISLLILKYNRAVAVMLFILACAIGVARVFAGVHHIEDILGAIAAAGIAIVFTDLFIAHLPKNKLPKQDT